VQFAKAARLLGRLTVVNESLARLTLPSSPSHDPGPIAAAKAAVGTATATTSRAGWWPRLWPRMALRHWLTLPYVALVTGVALTVGTLSYLAGSQAVDTLSNKLLLEMTDRVGQAIDRHVVGSAAALEAAFPDGMAAPASVDADMAGLRSRFWIATSLHLDPNNYVYYGNRAGQFFGLWRHSRAQGELRMKLKPDEPRSFARFTGIEGTPVDTTQEATVYDPRSRPWYRAGQTQPAHTWTSIYIDYRTAELVATRARRVLDARGEFAGVVATDLSLRGLNDFVRRLRLSQNGVAFVIERDGKLVASSRSDNVLHLADGENVRINVADSSDALERAAYQAVKQSHIAMATGAGSLNFSGPTGDASTLAYSQIKDAVGLDWIVVVAAPRSDLMGGITDNVIRTALIAAAAAMAAVLLGLAILRWISRDLTRLAQAARAIGEGAAEVPITIERQDEIGELANCFRLMQRRLRIDHLTGLVNRDALVKRMDERIRRHRRAVDAQTFAVLFIDIDDFKLVNDRWGHDTGDRVLIEIGQRLHASTRSTDLVARYAGDEFVVLLDSVDSAEMAAQVRQKVETVLRQPWLSATAGSSTVIPMSGSVGLAVFAAGSDHTSDDLIKRADADMYQRKAVAKRG
jgi:diguanylate cyclase (GGDEF)-like protein